jgi:hypothetical protein
MASKLVSLLVLVPLAVGCGGSEPHPASTSGASASSAASEPKASTDAQVKVGHFTTADGMYGLVLDRSGTPIKLQVDGDKDVVELTQKEVRGRSGELEGYALHDPANVKRVVITKDGRVQYLRGSDAHWVTSDRDAAPLGTPTIAGAAVEKPREPSEADKLAAELAKVAVRTKMPDMKAEDSAQLAKIEAAFAKADAAMFVRYRKPDSNGWVARSQVVPDSHSGFSYGGGDFSTDDDEAKRYAGLAKHGAKLIGVSSPERDMGNHILVRRSDKRDELADGTPGLIWEMDGTRATFVTFDGGRYRVDVNQGGSKSVVIERGAGPESGWPAPLQDTYVDENVVSSLAKAGALPEQSVKDVEAVDKEWNDCVAKQWKPKRIATGVNHRAEAVRIHEACRSAMQKMEKTLVKTTEERAAARKALHDKAAARAKSVGAAK